MDILASIALLSLWLLPAYVACAVTAFIERNY